MDSAGTTTLPAPSNYPLNGRLAKPSEEISNSVSPASMSGKVNLGNESSSGLDDCPLYNVWTTAKTSKEMNV